MPLEKHKWLISTVLAVLALLVPIIIFLFSTSKKAFDFEIRSRMEITEDSISVDGLKITINEEVVENIYVYAVKISNSGSEPILKGDFEKPLSIYVSEDSSIYSAKKKRTYPENLSLDFKVKNNRLIILPMLLNPSDEYEIDLYSSSSEYPKVDARIAGISRVNSTCPDSKKLLKKITTAVLSFLLMIFYAKYLRLAIPVRTYNRRVPYIFNNAVLGLTCGYASIQLFKNQFGLVDKIIIIALSLIPVTIGIYCAYRERKYNKAIEDGSAITCGS